MNLSQELLLRIRRVNSYINRVKEEKPSPLLILQRFQKFVLGFIAASLLASIALFSKTQKQTIGFIQNWLFAFVAIGLGTEFGDFKNIGGRPLAAFVLAQSFNIVFTFIRAWLLFGELIPL